MFSSSLSIAEHVLDLKSLRCLKAHEVEPINFHEQFVIPNIITFLKRLFIYVCVSVVSRIR